jgi:signal recognition particle subunit SRP54
MKGAVGASGAGVTEFAQKAGAIIRSMTPQERRHPEIIDGSRRRRIARGSGTHVQDVNELLKQVEQARKMAKQLGQIERRVRLFR